MEGDVSVQWLSEIYLASTLCRACGQNLPDDPALSDSFQNYAHMYLEFTNLQLHPRENPEELRICPDCKNKLHEFQQLRETFINVHWRLLEVKPELRDNHEVFDSNAVVEKNPSINEAIVSDMNSLEQDVSQNNLYNQTTEQLESIVKVEPVDYCSEDNADDGNEQKAFGYSFQITKESSSDSELSSSSTSDDQSEMLPPKMKKKKKSLEELYPYDKSQRNKFYIPRKRKKFPRQFDCRCPKKCSTLFESEQVLEHFFHKFWASVDKTRQRKMVLEYVRAMPVRRIRCRPQRVRPERAVMFQYFVPTEGGDVRVCQRFFLGILQTTSQTVYRYIYGKTGDRDSAQDEIIIP
ncbi:AAEL015046-PA [Aedes aegypti]|uniref:AAEL015046-PA n=1 Tax=Aedes aegypti TaxID=7159 RepID=Q16ES4_AEDAE|nr:AAEL015046-PA [Aedes aegypti]